MFKNKINYHFLNAIFVLLIVYLLYLTFGIWGGIVGTIFKILLPFIIAFTIAYALYPFVRKLMNKNIKKGIAITIVISIVVAVIALVIWLVIPVMIKQLGSLITWLVDFVKSLSSKYNIDLGSLQQYLGNASSFISGISKSLSDSFFSIVNKSVNIVTLAVIAFIAAVYFLSYMQSIRNGIKKYLKRKNMRTFNYIKRLDHEVSQYFVGLEKFMIVQFFEYTFVFFLIGHPYYLLLGTLCSITTVIPYFGGIFSNIVACVTAFFVSKTLFILSLIVTFIMPNIDGYIISPRIYGSTNNVPALLTIFAAYAGGKLFGFVGIVIALPLTIILLSTYRFYEEDISQKLEDMKKNKKAV